MKKTLFIPLLFLFACHSEDKETIAFLNEGIKRCNSTLSIQNDRCLLDFEAFIKEKALTGKPFKTRIDKIKEKSEETIRAIDEKKAKISDDENLANGVDLLKTINEYKHLIDNIFPNDTTIQFLLKNELNELDFNEFDLVQYSGLENKIHRINHLALTKLYKSIEYPFFRANRFESAIFPKSTYLYRGEIYETKIALLGVNKNFTPIIIIDSDTLEVKNGKATYIADTANSVGVFKKSGICRFISYDGVVFDNQFEFEYQVIKK